MYLLNSEIGKLDINRIYRYLDNRVYMYFGDSSIEKDLSGEFIEGAWLLVDQLNPEAGQCTLTD